MDKACMIYAWVTRDGVLTFLSICENSNGSCTGTEIIWFLIAGLQVEGTTWQLPASIR